MMPTSDDLPNPNVADLPDDPRLTAAVQEYLAQLESGQRPHRQDFGSRYPDLSGPLNECLDGLELVYKTAIRENAFPAVAAGAAAASTDPLLANPLGDFKIVREIGRGGMGIVYE